MTLHVGHGVILMQVEHLIFIAPLHTLIEIYEEEMQVIYRRRAFAYTRMVRVALLVVVSALGHQQRLVAADTARPRQCILHRHAPSPMP